MTVTCTNTKHIYPGDGQRRKWPFTFPLFNAAHLRLWRVGADGKAVLKTTGFYVDMEEKEVLYPLESEQEPVPAEGEYIVLQRVTPLTQEFDVKRQQNLDLQTWEDAHDLAVLREQELAEELSRALKFPVQNQNADTDAAGYLAAITQLKDEAARESQQALESSRQACQNAQQAKDLSAQAVQEAQAAKDSLSAYAQQAQTASQEAQESGQAAQQASTQAQGFATSAGQDAASAQDAAQTVAQYHQETQELAQSAQSHAQTAQQAASSATASAQAAAQSAQQAVQNAAVIVPDNYVKKSGDVMTGPLQLPAPAAGLNDNTAITAAWVRTLITGKTVVKDYITERFSDETGNWYELYASGWIKQGGIGVYTGLVGEQTVTLLKPMANANYSLMPLMVSKRGGYDQFPVLTSVTTTNFKFTVVNAIAGVAPLFTWRAEGYKAQGA